MAKGNSQRKFLAAAVLCSLLTTAPVWAATQTATDTVTTSNSAGTRYTSINVTQESATTKTAIVGIANKTPIDMTVYMAPGATISVSSAADGTGIGRRAVGIKNDTIPLTVDEALNLTVTAATVATSQGSNMYISATGVSNDEADLTLGQDGAANTITVKADAGTYTGTETGSSTATATGIVPRYGSITISGDTTLNVSAQGMVPGAASDVDEAGAMATGIGSGGFMLGAPILGTPILGGSSTIKLGNLTGTISAQGGTVNTDSGSSAYATANGINTRNTTLTADSVNLTVQAAGGTAGGAASAADVYAQAMGITQYSYSGGSSGAKFTVTGPTSLKVSATGGSYEGTGSAKSSYALAYGIGKMDAPPYMPGISYSGTYKLSDVTAVVSATGGTDNAGSTDPDNPTAGGDVSAVAAGVATGIGSLTAKSLDLTVSAQGGTAAGKNATIQVVASGLNQANYSSNGPTDTATIQVTGATKLNVTAAGGNTTGTGSTSTAQTSATGLVNNIIEDALDPLIAAMELGAVSGNITATGGTVNAFTANTTAAGAVNGYDIVNHDDTIGGILSLDSLDLTVTATGAKLTGETKYASTSVAGVLQDNYSDSQYGNSTLTITGATNLQVTATGATPVDNGTLKNAYTQADGLYILANMGKSSSYTVADLGPVTATVTANGGTANMQSSNISTEAIGLYMVNKVAAKSLDLTVTATGGTVKGATDGAANQGTFETFAFGIQAEPTNAGLPTTLTVPGAVNLQVTATAGTAAEGAAVKNNSAMARGISLGDEKATGTTTATLGSVTGTVAVNGVAASGEGSYSAVGISAFNDAHLTTGDVDLTVTGTSTVGNDQDAHLSAGGLLAFENSDIQVNGNATIKTAVNPVAGTEGYGNFEAVALDAFMATINVGTDGEGNSLGKTVQVEGDVAAVADGTVNLTLDNSASYLQGNVITKSIEGMPAGTVNLVVANGATWRPVYDNRYGSFNNETLNHAPGYTVTENSIDTLTLQDGGIVDLTWDNPTRSSEFRTLSVGNLTGDNGVFKINADLANNKADSISVGAGSASTQAYIDVAYDPYFASETLSAGKSITGKATVVTASPTTMTFAGKQDSYNLYTYTPTLVNNGDGTWDLTALTIDSAKTSGHVKTAGVDRLGLNSLFQFEINSLAKRLGELRETPDAESGVWARYYDGKLEQGDASLKAHLFQAGYDKSSIGASEKTYRGAALSYAKGDGTYALGSGDMKETTLSLYQTGIKNDGRYYDVVLKAGKYMNDYDVTATANPSSADYDTWAYSISGEMGKRFDLGQGLYVEPQAELILGRLNGADYTTSTGMNVSVDAQNKAITRLGLAFGKSYTRGSLYGKFSYYHDFGSGVNLNAADGGNSVGYSEDLARNWTELTIGGSAKLGKNANAYAEVSKYMGQLSSNVRYNIGARWSF